MKIFINILSYVQIRIILNSFDNSDDLTRDLKLRRISDDSI